MPATKSQATKRGKIILVAGSKGGSGKTTMIVNLAAMRQARGGNCLIVDSDKQASASKWVIRRNLTPELDGSVQVVQSFGEILPRTVLQMAEHYTDVFIDSAGRDSPEMRRAWAIADVVIIPMGLSLLDLETLSILDEVHQLARVTNPTIVPKVVLRTPPNPKKSELERAINTIEERDGFELLDVRFPTRVLHQRSTDEGMSTEEIAGQAEGEQDVSVNEARALYEAIYGR